MYSLYLHVILFIRLYQMILKGFRLWKGCFHFTFASMYFSGSPPMRNNFTVCKSRGFFFLIFYRNNCKILMLRDIFDEKNVFKLLMRNVFVINVNFIYSDRIFECCIFSQLLLIHEICLQYRAIFTKKSSKAKRKKHTLITFIFPLLT